MRKQFRKIAAITDWKNIENFRRAGDCVYKKNRSQRPGRKGIFLA